MKILILLSIFLLSCGELEPSNELDDANLAHAKDDEACTYQEPIEVNLSFQKREKQGAFYEVSFMVLESGAQPYSWKAKLQETCALEFEKKGIIPGFVERIQNGTCTPEIIRPKDFGSDCWFQL